MALRVLLVPMVTLPKFKPVGLEVNRPPEIPLPARAIVKVGFEAFETTAIAPLALPTTFAVKSKNDTLSLIQAQSHNEDLQEQLPLS